MSDQHIDEALVRALLERIKSGDKEIDTTPHTDDAQADAKLNDYMHILQDRGLIKVKHKHLGGVWDIEGLTFEGENYLNTLD